MPKRQLQCTEKPARNWRKNSRKLPQIKREKTEKKRYLSKINKLYFSFLLRKKRAKVYAPALEINKDNHQMKFKPEN